MTPYLTTEQWLREAERVEAEIAQERAARATARVLPPPAPRAGSLLGSPVHDYVKGGRLPLGYRRIWRSPTPGARPVAAGIEIDPSTAPLVREIFLLVRAGRTLKEIAEAISRQYGRRIGSTRVHATLHHPIHRAPVTELQIVDADLRREALTGLRQRRGRSRALLGQRAGDRSQTASRE